MSEDARKDFTSYDLLNKAARRGDRDSTQALAKALVSDPTGRTRQWIERAAEEGSWSASHILSQAPAEPSAESLRWHSRALQLAETQIDMGNTNAMVFVASQIHKVDLNRAVRVATRAALAGNVAAMGCLASWLLVSDPEQSRIWEDRASEHGEVNALLTRAHRLRYASPEEAKHYYRLIAEQGHVPAMQPLAELLKRQGLDEEARSWLSAAAEAGDSQAMIQLGDSLFNSDLDASIAWYKKAANSRNTTGMRRLAAAIEFRDWDGALEWLHRACDLGDEKACSTLANAPKRRPLAARYPILGLAAEKKRARRRADRSEK